VSEYRLALKCIDGDHGRIEQRSVRASSGIEWLKERHPHWPGLRSIVAVTAERECNNGHTSEETRYFISSLMLLIHHGLVALFVRTGALKTICIGCWIMLLMKIPTAHEK